MPQVSQVPQASQTYNKLNNFGKNGKLVRSHEQAWQTEKVSTTHASSQILLVVVLVGKSNCGHVRSSPASVPPLPVLRQPDTFTLKNFELLVCYWHWHKEFPLFLATFPASPSSKKFFHRMKKNNH